MRDLALASTGAAALLVVLFGVLFNDGGAAQPIYLGLGTLSALWLGISIGFLIAERIGS